MRATVAVLILATAGACTSDSSSATVASTVSDTPPASIVTDQLLAELDLEALARPVSRLRELEFLEPVPVQIVEDSDYLTRVSGVEGPPRELPPDRTSRWLQLLGVLPSGLTVDAATSRLLQTSVAFYDDQSGSILVRASAGVDPYVESVVVHELVHALQDQHFGAADTRLLDCDQGYVYAALVEGDAERVARRFIGELSQADEFAYEEGRLNASESFAAIRDGTPRFVLESVTQPTGHGVRFLQGLDYETVNGFFADLPGLTSLPPSSNAMIIPEAEAAGPELDLRPLSVHPYEQVSAEPTLGLGRLRILLGQAMDPTTADQAVLGWAADRFEVRASGEDVIFAYLYAGTREEDAEELAAAFRALLDSTLLPGAYGSVRLAGNQVLVLAASDPAMRERLDELYGNFGEEVFLVLLG